MAYVRSFQSGGSSESILVAVNLADGPRSVILDLRRLVPPGDHSVSDIISGATCPDCKTGNIEKYPVNLGPYAYAYLLLKPSM